MTALLVIAGAALGAPLRYLTDLFVQSRHDSLMPWGTLVVNVSGSLLLGVVAGAVDATGGHEWALALVGTGFCGALTTFSTFSFETLRLLEENALLHAAVNVTLSVVAGVIACFGGWSLASMLF
jgi:fluoride exporter